METKSVLRDWRVWVLCILSYVALMLMAGDAEDMGVFVLTKLLGVSLMVIVWLLGKLWREALTDEYDEEL